MVLYGFNVEKEVVIWNKFNYKGIYLVLIKFINILIVK